MNEQQVSVIVVSRGRPTKLLRCLLGLSQLFHTDFEVIVVADPTGCLALEQSKFNGRVKLLAFDRPNISEARNIGLASAAGKVVAFIDDDAVAEPTWLDKLTDPFKAPDIDAAGGFVRGRNGITFQWQGQIIDRLGRETDLGTTGQGVSVFVPEPETAIKTVGTNCAFRTDVLRLMGGFDPCFAFFLDDCDLNMRLGLAGRKTGIVPNAQVHHGYAASVRRLGNRFPTSLFDVGASTAVFLRKYAPDDRFDDQIAEMTQFRRAGLLAHMIRGTCAPRDVAAVLQTLAAGVAAGKIRQIQSLPEIRSESAPFLPFLPVKRKGESKVVFGRRFRASATHAAARAAVEKGMNVTANIFSLTALYHKVAFSSEGYWVQTGGLFGKSDRSEKLWQWNGMKTRNKQEIRRIADVRFQKGEKL